MNVVVDDRMSLSSVGNRLHTRMQRQRTHGLQIAAPSVGDRGCRCWRRAATSVLVRRWPVSRSKTYSLVTDRWMFYGQVGLQARVDTADIAIQRLILFLEWPLFGFRRFQSHIFQPYYLVSIFHFPVSHLRRIRRHATVCTVNVRVLLTDWWQRIELFTVSCSPLEQALHHWVMGYWVLTYQPRPLTLSRPVMLNGYTLKRSGLYWSNPQYLNLWHYSGTLALNPDCQSSRSECQII